MWTKLVLWPFLVGYYSYRSAVTTGPLGPVTALALFAIGVGINRLLAGRLVGLYFDQERWEGHLRFLHVHVRTHAEAIAFWGGGCEETNTLATSLARVLNNLRLIVHDKFFVDFATQFFNYLGSALAYAVVAVPIFTGAFADLTDADLAARISEAAFLNMYLVSLLTEVILLANHLAALAGYTARLEELARWLDAQPAMDVADGRADATLSALADAAEPVLTLEDLTVAPPGGRGAVLVRGLTASIGPGASLVITGPSGTGKTSLLRTLRGLWAPEHGTVRWRAGLRPLEPWPGAGLDDLSAPGPAGGRVLFLPQEPYLTAGTLADQVVYPLSSTQAPLERACTPARRVLR